MAFSMDGHIHVLYGFQHTPVANTCPAPVQYLSELKVIQIDLSDFSVAASVGQQFSEQNLHYSGHFVDESGLHYLALSHSNQLSVYRRLIRGCRFELIQNIPDLSVTRMILFKFGTTNLLEQYMATLADGQLTIWKHRGNQFSKVFVISLCFFCPRPKWIPAAVDNVR